MTAPAIALVTPEQELYRAEKARRVNLVRPEMVAAAAELQRLDDQMRERAKGGRPKGPPMLIGRARSPRGRAREPDPEMPGRPEWLTPPTPPRDEPAPTYRQPSSSTPMAAPRTYAPRKCMLPSCGKEFTPTGSKQRFCGVDHRDLFNGAPSKAKASKPEKKRKPASTGFASPRSKPVPTPGLDGAIAHIEQEIASVDEQIAGLNAQKERLLGAIESLQEIAAA